MSTQSSTTLHWHPGVPQYSRSCSWSCLLPDSKDAVNTFRNPRVAVLPFSLEVGDESCVTAQRSPRTVLLMKMLLSHSMRFTIQSIYESDTRTSSALSTAGRTIGVNVKRAPVIKSKQLMISTGAKKKVESKKGDHSHARELGALDTDLSPHCKP